MRDMGENYSPEKISQTLERVLLDVQRPARYVGGEHNSVVKPWTSERIKVALAFPEIYDLGMPNLGLAIFYDILNSREDMLAERVYLPWVDMEEVMRKVGSRQRLTKIPRRLSAGHGTLWSTICMTVGTGTTASPPAP